MLIKEKRSPGAPRQPCRCARQPDRRRHRPPHLPAPLGARRRRPCRARRAAARRRAQGRGREHRPGAAEGRHQEEHLHPLLGRLHGDRRGARTACGSGQEPGWDSPINRGTHCAKGAATRELVHGDRRLRYPMKMVNGQWQRISWDTAIDEIGDKLLRDPREVRARIRCTGSAPPSSPTRRPI